MTHCVPEFVKWPGDRFFWAVLDAPGVDPRGRLPEGLLPELADLLPVPVEEVVAVAARAYPVEQRGAARLLVCAIRRAELDRVAAGARGFYPDSIPESLGLRAPISSFNFLVGEYEPRQDRIARLKVHALGAFWLVLLAVLASIGLARRAAHEARAATACRSAAEALAAELVPGQNLELAALAIEQEVTRLRRNVKAAGALALPPDASVGLAGLLDAWPSIVPSKPQSLSVSPSVILASVLIEGDPSAFLQAVKAPPGWSLEEPRINGGLGSTRVSLTMRPPTGARAR